MQEHKKEWHDKLILVLALLFGIIGNLFADVINDLLLGKAIFSFRNIIVFVLVVIIISWIISDFKRLKRIIQNK